MSDTTNIVRLTWEIIDIDCNTIANNIIQSNRLPDVIISIGRGGMIPARIISDLLSVKNVYMFNIKLYTGINKRAEIPTIESFNHYIEGKNVLLVDDIMDSGKTIEAVINALQAKKPKSIRTATLVCKKHVVNKPSFYVITCNANDWIVFPWERNEFKEKK